MSTKLILVILCSVASLINCFAINNINQKSKPLSNLQASPLLKFQVCKNAAIKNITAPENYVITVEKLVVGVSPSSNCEEYNPEHCSLEVTSICNLKGKC